MWWLIDGAPDFWGRGPGFESGISHNNVEILREEREIYPWGKKDRKNIVKCAYLPSRPPPPPPRPPPCGWQPWCCCCCCSAWSCSSACPWREPCSRCTPGSSATSWSSAAGGSHWQTQKWNFKWKFFVNNLIFLICITLKQQKRHLTLEEKENNNNIKAFSVFLFCHWKDTSFC